MFDFSKQQEQAKYFFSLLASKSNILIDLHYINHQALLDRSINKKLIIAKSIKFKEAYRCLKNDNAFYKNKMRLENVYCNFSQNQNYNIATIDDIERVEEFKAKNHFLLIQTSKSKYQAFFKIDEYVNANDLAKIQKVLQQIYNGDKAATGAYQLKRVAGFINTKYLDDFVVKIIHKGNNILNAKEIVKYYEEHINIKQKPLQKLQIKSDKKSKNWSDFYKDDYSSADFSYALYLLHFFDEEQAKEILKKESKNLEERKGAYMNDYIERTISKALSFFDKND
jgi:hypothetical protein